MTYVTVKGGTNAGWRRVSEPKAWTCKCGVERRTYSCIGCGDRRPSDS